jgi:SAM-dependent methyltransferase
MSYLEIAKHYDECFQKFGDSHLGVDWPNFIDTQKRHKIMFDIMKDDEKIQNSSLLDFGCGLGHFYEWMKMNKEIHPVYFGLDINKSFYDFCSQKFSNIEFLNKDILYDDNIPEFDYIICNGVFTEKRELSYDEMFNFMTKCLCKLWNKTKKGIAFNVMSKFVDWERDDLFHMSLDELGWFLKNNLSKEFVIRNDYGLYEYTIYVYKK